LNSYNAFYVYFATLLRETSIFLVIKENEGLGKLCSALFLLFTLFYDLFGSFSHANNLKATIGSDLYLKFAKG
jgi:hypothetical protein